MSPGLAFVPCLLSLSPDRGPNKLPAFITLFQALLRGRRMEKIQVKEKPLRDLLTHVSRMVTCSNQRGKKHDSLPTLSCNTIIVVVVVLKKLTYLRFVNLCNLSEDF